jgi:hypothetical protein
MVIDMAPFDPPSHVTFVVLGTIVKPAEEDMGTDKVAVQLLELLTVTVYVPVPRPVKSSFVDASDQI